jgi:hypothetical protein
MINMKASNHINHKEDINSKLRVCKGCHGTFKFLDMAGAGQYDYNGIEYRRNNCKPCEYQRKAKQRRNKSIKMQKFKQNLECSSCHYSKKNRGNKFTVKALDFHHTEKNKCFNISDMVRQCFSWKRIKEEMNKCIVICKNCHVEEHYADN